MIYRFDRYVHGGLMAQGIKIVDCETVSGARRKAHRENKKRNPEDYRFSCILKLRKRVEYPVAINDGGEPPLRCDSMGKLLKVCPEGRKEYTEPEGELTERDYMMHSMILDEDNNVEILCGNIGVGEKATPVESLVTCPKCISVIKG